MDERLRFVAQLLDGEAMSEVCRAFGISRKTGYKIFERYKEHGLEALTDRSRRPIGPIVRLSSRRSEPRTPRARRQNAPTRSYRLSEGSVGRSICILPGLTWRLVQDGIAVRHRSGLCRNPFL
jgi:transposase-like protein